MRHPGDNQKFRDAVAYAIDKDAIIRGSCAAMACPPRRS
jgi:ABC-type transport system substrate-binding protein